GRGEGVGARETGEAQGVRLRGEGAVQGREKQGEIELAESVQGSIWHGQHDIFGRIRDGYLLPFACDPDDTLVVAQLLNQAPVADLVRLHHEGLDAEGTR